MAAIFDALDEGLVRTTGLIAAATAYYTATWWVYLPAVPGAGITRTLYMVANSANRAGQSICVTQDDTGTVRLVVAGTARPGVVVAPGWHALAVGRRAPATFVELYVDTNTQASTATVDFTGWTFNELYLGVDPRATGAIQQVAYFREWPAFLGTYTTEFQSPVPVRTSDLDTDTPLDSDLLDLTAHDHDWTHVGGGAQTFQDVPYAPYGALGGWWRHSAFGAMPLTTATCVLRAEAAPTLGSGSARLIVEARMEVLGFHTTGSHVDTVDWAAHLRYGTGPTTADVVDTSVANPFPDPAIGYDVPPEFVVAGPRADYCTPVRWALVFRCSTWDPDTSTYAADGHAALWMNGSLLLSASDVTIPRRPNGAGVQYTIGIQSDCDRVWARTEPTVPATTSEGAFSSGVPSGLVYSEEFETGAYPSWTVVSLFPGGGTALAPTSYADAGGDGGWGLSAFGAGPGTGDPGLTVPYAGLARFQRFPPLPLDVEPPPIEPPPIEPPIEPPAEPPVIAPPTTTDVRYTRRLRRAPHLAQENTRVFYRRFELDLERGQGLVTGQGEDPMVLLRISRDGGQTWGEEQRLPAGKLGAYQQRVIARRLGHGRDVVFEVVVSDPIAWSLVGAWLDLDGGTS